MWAVEKNERIEARQNRNLFAGPLTDGDSLIKN